MEELITFETAELAKQKGFNEPTIDWFEKRRNGKWEEEYPPSYDFGYSSHNRKENCIARPTQSMLQKWLREDCFIVVLVGYNMDGTFYGTVFVNDDERNLLETTNPPLISYDSYEEILENILKEGLKKIKEKV